MKKNLVILVLAVLVLVPSAFAWNYKKEVIKYLKSHPNQAPFVTAAFNETTLIADLDMEAAIIIAKELAGWNWMKETKTTEYQDESRKKMTVVEVFYEYRDPNTKILVSHTTFVTMTFVEGKLLKWTVTIPK